MSCELKNNLPEEEMSEHIEMKKTKLSLVYFNCLARMHCHYHRHFYMGFAPHCAFMCLWDARLIL